MTFIAIKYERTKVTLCFGLQTMTATYGTSDLDFLGQKTPFITINSSHLNIWTWTNGYLYENVKYETLPV